MLSDDARCRPADQPRGWGPRSGFWLLACFASFCLLSTQSGALCAGPTAGQATPILRLDALAPANPLPARSYEHAFFKPPPLEPPFHNAAFTGDRDIPPEPVSVPLPPVLLPAAVVLGWVILHKRRRHP